jgi:hypothetical protein
MFPFDRFASWSPADAQERLRKGNLPRRMRVKGELALANASWLTELPRDLVADSIDLSNCLRLRELPARVRCNDLIVGNTSIAALDGAFEVQRAIIAMDCRRLERVGTLRVPQLRLGGCGQVRHLSDGLAVWSLDLRGCRRLTALPASLGATLRNLDVSDCSELSELPSGLVHLHTLNVQGCTKLKSLPDGIGVQLRIEVAGSGLEALPYSLRSTQVTWRGIPVSDRVAFSPETITVREILGETNLERRRVLLERVGMERFFADARAETLDSDVDAGGPRRLLRVPFQNGEDVACLEVCCPSTGRKYVLRVPPETRTCAEGAAWIAGFSSPRHYRPVVET